jgi:O-antigen/teichoic acid export membrane protein
LALVIVSAVLATGLNLILIPKWGAVGAAIGSGAGVVILNFGRLIILRRFLGVFPYSWRTVNLILTGLIAVTLAWLATPLGNHVKGGILLSVFTMGTLFVGLEREDRDIFEKLKRRIGKRP